MELDLVVEEREEHLLISLLECAEGSENNIYRAIHLDSNLV